QELNQGPIQRADGSCVEFLVTIPGGHQTCPAVGANPTVRDNTRNTLLVDPRKATKGRRMSKKTRKKSSKTTAKTTAGTTAKKPTAAKAARGSSKALAKTKAAKAGKAVAKKPGNPTKSASP